MNDAPNVNLDPRLPILGINKDFLTAPLLQFEGYFSHKTKCIYLDVSSQYSVSLLVQPVIVRSGWFLCRVLRLSLELRWRAQTRLGCLPLDVFWEKTPALHIPADLGAERCIWNLLLSLRLLQPSFTVHNYKLYGWMIKNVQTAGIQFESCLHSLVCKSGKCSTVSCFHFIWRVPGLWSSLEFKKPGAFDGSHIQPTRFHLKYNM